MTSRRLFLHGAAIGGLALGTAGLTGGINAHAAMPTDRIKRNLNGLGYSGSVVKFQADHRLVQDGKAGAITQSVLAAMVSLVQNKAGATMDSSWGDATTSAVKSYQSKNGLEADGKAGPLTMSKMGITRVVGLGTSSIGGSIRRTEVIQRGAYWPNIGLDYSRNRPWHRDINNSSTYRKDCSGLVSNAWHATTAYSTRTLDQISSVISKASLLPGDILNCYDYHTLLFCGWANTARTAMYTLEERGSSGAVAKEVTGYPYYNDGKAWKPRRYSKIVWG
ncbi:MAG TPA: peptidoglycan-binding protein [Candidatus Avipropionibacterium avicola]|uniref:Peptidoglycan-binding protein n=1 Tax=Candidatus Avipropionibacterium avicola TaxID=2840701 RepID=A0A9D1KLN4_9ACTN|nr:peptidoglycan-binding protein [Candidatus Avipropionibacterium avicola]